MDIANYDSVWREQHKTLFDCGPFGFKSRTISQTALAVSHVCQMDREKESAEAVRLIVSSQWLSSLQTEHDLGEQSEEAPVVPSCSWSSLRVPCSSASPLEIKKVQGFGLRTLDVWPRWELTEARKQRQKIRGNFRWCNCRRTCPMFL